MASASVPNATANMRMRATPTPSATPRAENRALSVTTGIASQDRVGVSMLAGEGDRAGDRHFAECPGAEQQVLGPRRPRRPPLGNLEDRARDHEREQRPPAEPGAARDQRKRDHAYRRSPHRPQTSLHVQQPLAVHVVATEPRPCSHSH